MQLIIGIGNKARQGKDYVASYIASLNPKIKIIHWADSLKEEVQNKERKFPLVKLQYFDSTATIGYKLLDSINSDGKPTYKFYMCYDVPYLDTIMTSRGITEYWGSNDKDREMLQFWGTQYRRELCDRNYWVNKTLETIKTLPEDAIVLIPDTRFKNEKDAITQREGKYIRVLRFNPNGTIYIETLGDKNHASEIDLDDVSVDYAITALSGDLKSLEKNAVEVFKEIGII